MAKKTIGYVKLEWVCPNCNTKNPGPQKTCSSCGAPQPDNVVFIKAEHDVLLTDEKELTQAKFAPDIHCPFCGTRNVASAKVCTQCGGDLTDAQARQSGQILGAYQDKAKTIACPNCGTENLAASSYCISCGGSLVKQPVSTAQKPTSSPLPVAAAKKKINPLFIILPVIALILVCILIFVLSNKKSDVSAVVSNSFWERSIAIEEFGPVTETDWISNIPDGAKMGECQSYYSHTSDEPEASSTEVCGTPYVVDEGTGYGEAVSDCVYEVYEDKCEYTTDQWYTFTTLSLDGTNQTADWPETSLTSDQREGTRSETYTIKFEQGSDTYTYTTSSYSEYLEFTPGSEWLLSVNAFGNITDIQPVN